MRILCVCNDQAETTAIAAHLPEHQVDSVVGNLVAINKLSLRHYDFLLMLDCGDDCYHVDELVDFAGKHRVPMLVVEGEAGVKQWAAGQLQVQPVAKDYTTVISDRTYYAFKDAVRLNCLSELVEQAYRYWCSRWNLAKVN